MSRSNKGMRRFGPVRLSIAILVLWMTATLCITAIAPPPVAVAIAGNEQSVHGARFLADDSWLDVAGERRLDQSIFDALFERIDAARRLVYVDMFLFNDWQGPVAERQRALADQLADRLAAAAQRPGGPSVILVTDPINTVYGGLESARLQRLRHAGVVVVLTDLAVLQDSNPVWSSLWRWLVRPFGNSPQATTLPNPFGDGRVSVRSWLALFNFKANHRKLAIFDVAPDPDDSGWRVLVTSGNPHDGSSAHRNVALEIGGGVVADVLAAERALLESIDARAALAALAAVPGLPQRARVDTDRALADARPGTIQLVNESAILHSLRKAIAATGSGDAISLEMFYLAERSLVQALGDAARRGVQVRVLLDVNSDAFGRAKNGVPNRPVAAELNDAGVQVRWCATRGEQCHAKWVHVRSGEDHRVWLGSGNLTRRNLADFNLETDLLYRTSSADVAGDLLLAPMLERFDQLWNNLPDRTYSVAYPVHADDSILLTWQYRFMEATGLSTF